MLELGHHSNMYSVYRCDQDYQIFLAEIVVPWLEPAIIYINRKIKFNKMYIQNKQKKEEKKNLILPLWSLHLEQEV